MANTKNSSPKKAASKPKTTKTTKASPSATKKERQAPDEKSHDYDVGFILKGNDGKDWIVTNAPKMVNGTTWKRVPRKEQSDYVEE